MPSANPNTALVRTLNREVKARGWSARELGRRAGITGMYATDLLAGRKSPGVGVLCRLADALGLSLDALTGRTPAK